MDKLLVVLLDVAHTCILHQCVAVLHLCTERLEDVHRLGDIGDDGVLLIGQLCQIVLLDALVDAELHHLWVNEHNLEL